jgi:uncharacterized surface anchored protein
MRMRLALIFVCVAALAAGVPAQTLASTKEPARASLEGNVVKEPGGEAIKKAIVELIGENQEENGNYTATSDPDGHFKISNIQTGRYRMFVERTGYIEVDKKRRRSQGVSLSIAAGQELKDQVLHMLPAAIITGRVIDEDGDPLSNVEVTVLRRKAASGYLKLEPTGSSQTNDLGEYRVGGLLPGKYYLSASPMPSFQSLVPPPKNSDEAATADPDLMYVPTFYPNTTDRTQAAAIELHAGDDMPVDFSLTRSHTMRIRGSVVGLAPGASAVVMLRGRDSNGIFRAGEVDKDGRFEVPHVAPGSYVVMAMTVLSDTPRLARGTVEVGDANIEGLRLSLLAGATVRGRLHFGPKARTVDPSLLFAYLRRIDGEDDFSDTMMLGEDGAAGSPTLGRVKADGSFELKNVSPGVYEVNLSGDSKGIADSSVESVAAGTKDTTDTGLNVNGGTISIDVTLSSGAGVVEGSVTNDKDEAIANAVVVAIPEAQYRKQQSRYQRVTTDQSGHFNMRGLRPGEYSLLAWEVLDGDDYLDPEYLKAYESHETVIHVGKGGHPTTSLKMIPATLDPP